MSRRKEPAIPNELLDQLLAGGAASAAFEQGGLLDSLKKSLTERALNAEKVRLEAQLSSGRQTPPSAEMLPHPVLKARFEEKVAALRASLDTDATRPEASQILSRLLESVTIYPDSPGGPEAEVVALTGTLASFAMNDNSPQRGSAGGCSVTLVAGTRTERCHTSPIIDI
jgi:site-specific DNA recombinase